MTSISLILICSPNLIFSIKMSKFKNHLSQLYCQYIRYAYCQCHVDDSHSRKTTLITTTKKVYLKNARQFIVTVVYSLANGCLVCLCEFTKKNKNNNKHAMKNDLIVITRVIWALFVEIVFTHSLVCVIGKKIGWMAMKVKVICGRFLSFVYRRSQNMATKRITNTLFLNEWRDIANAY